MINFSEWTVKDPDSTLTISKNRVEWTKADRTKVRYISKKQEITNNFKHKFVVCLNEGYIEDELNRGFIRFWELRQDWDNRVWIYARKTTSGWNIHFEQRHHGMNLWSFHGDYSHSWNQRYLINISRNDESYRLIVFDKVNSKLVDTGDIQGIKQSFQQIWIASTIKSRRNNRNWSTGYLENLIM